MEAARQRNPRSTRDRILDAAERAFVAHGFGEASLRDVARDAGVTRSLIHHHFRSKDDLWTAVLEQRFAAYFDYQHAVLDRPDLDADDLAESLRSMFRFLEGNPEVARLHGWSNAGSGGGFPDSGALTARGVERLHGMQREGKLRADLDPASVMAAFFALAEHWFQGRDGLRHRFGDALPDDSTYLETAARLLLGGVRSCPDEGPPLRGSS